MIVPTNFPTDADVIREEVARFRALSPDERIRFIRGLLAAGALMMEKSPKAAFLREYTCSKKPAPSKPSRSFLRAMPAKYDLIADEQIRAAAGSPARLTGNQERMVIPVSWLPAFLML